jgi:hypothetical protein
MAEKSPDCIVLRSAGGVRNAASTPPRSHPPTSISRNRTSDSDYDRLKVDRTGGVHLDHRPPARYRLGNLVVPELLGLPLEIEVPSHPSVK